MPQPKPERDSWLCGKGVRKRSESNVVQNGLAPVLSGTAVALQARGESMRIDGSATGDRDYPNRIQRCWPVRSVIGRMIPRVDTRYVALVLVFVFCQVIGAMCVLPDLSMAEGAALLMEEGVACPMEGTMMCPPSATSSPERQVKNGAVADADQRSAVPRVLSILTNPSAEPQWSWSSDCSPVLLSMSSSSVLPNLIPQSPSFTHCLAGEAERAMSIFFNARWRCCRDTITFSYVVVGLLCPNVLRHRPHPALCRQRARDWWCHALRYRSPHGSG